MHSPAETLEHLRNHAKDPEKRASMLIDNMVNHFRAGASNFADPQAMHSVLDEWQAHKGQLAASVAGNDPNPEETQHRAERADPKTGNTTDAGAGSGGGTGGVRTARSAEDDKNKRK